MSEKIVEKMENIKQIMTKRIVIKRMVGIQTFDKETGKRLWSTKEQFGADKVNLTFDFGTADAIIAGEGPLTVSELCKLALRSIVIIKQGQERRTSLSTGRYNVVEGKAISVADILTEERRTGQNREARDNMIARSERERIVAKLVEGGMTEEQAEAMVA